MYPVECMAEWRPGGLGRNGPESDGRMSVGVGGTTSTCISWTFSSLLGVSTIVDDCEGRRDPPPMSPIVVIVEAKLPDWSLRSDLGWLGESEPWGNKTRAPPPSIRYASASLSLVVVVGRAGDGEVARNIIISAASLSEGPGLEISSSPRFTFGGLVPGV